jgi:hypothetical protein
MEAIPGNQSAELVSHRVSKWAVRVELTHMIRFGAGNHIKATVGNRSAVRDKKAVSNQRAVGTD